MPIEDPRMPSDSYDRMLKRGGNGHLGLVAGEVAEFARPSVSPRGFIAFFSGVLAMLLAIVMAVVVLK